MEIPEIKSRLTLSKVINYYGFKADKQNRLKCPFHDDKTPSLQLYYKTQTCFCFSTNCKTHGKSIDVIDFIMHYENITKHQAIQKAGELLGEEQPTTLTTPIPQPKTTDPNRSQFIETIFTYFKNAVSNSVPAKDYIQSRGLSHLKTEIGYNSGQFHHGTRKDNQLITQSLAYGLLIDHGRKSRLGESAYQPFGKTCISFPLKGKENNIVSLYFRSILDNKNSRHYYLKDRQGLYPCYPDPSTRKLILTESIIDAATLLEQEPIKSNYGVLALYGTNGLTDEHQTAISELKHLEEIILFMDGDTAGAKAVEKYTDQFTSRYPHLTITQVPTPTGEDINSLLLGHTGEILQHLIDERTPLSKDTILLSSNEEEVIPIPPTHTLITSTEEPEPDTAIEAKQHTPVQPLTPPSGAGGLSGGLGLDTTNPYNLKYQCEGVLYQIKGFKSDQLDSLKVTLQITIP